jgi:hypothetical protein
MIWAKEPPRSHTTGTLSIEQSLRMIADCAASGNPGIRPDQYFQGVRAGPKCHFSTRAEAVYYEW